MLAVINLRIFTSITNYDHLSYIFCYITIKFMPYLKMKFMYFLSSHLKQLLFKILFKKSLCNAVYFDACRLACSYVRSTSAAAYRVANATAGARAEGARSDWSGVFVGVS